MLTRNRVWFSPVPFLSPLESSRGRALISRKRAAWKRSMEGLAVEQRPQWLPEEGNTGEHISGIFLHFLSWRYPGRARPWEDSGERALSICLECSITPFHNCRRKKTQLVQDEADTLSGVRSRGICYWGKQKWSHTKALVKTLKVSVSWFSQIRPKDKKESFPIFPYLTMHPELWGWLLSNFGEFWKDKDAAYLRIRIQSTSQSVLLASKSPNS